MAKNRMVNTHFWRDGWIGTLTPVEKLLFLYLLTSPETNVVGVYEIRVAQVALDTGIEESMVERILQRFQASGRVTYMRGWLIVHNFTKHQTLSGDRIERAKTDILEKLPEDVKNQFLQPNQSLFKPTAYPITNAYDSASLSKSKSLSNEDREKVTKVHEAYSVISKGARLTDGARVKIKARLKTYSVEELTTAITKFRADAWQMKHNSHRGMAWFFHSDDRIEQYINITPRKGIVEV